MGGKRFRERKGCCRCGFRFLGQDRIKMRQNTRKGHQGFSGYSASFGVFPAMAFCLAFGVRRKGTSPRHMGIVTPTNQR
jgi:hypothetical protein